MSIQLRRPIVVAGYGPASRGAIASDDARGARRCEASFAREREARCRSTRAIDVDDDAKRVLALRA